VKPGHLESASVTLPARSTRPRLHTGTGALYFDAALGTLVHRQYITEAHSMPADRLSLGLTCFAVQYKRKATPAYAAVSR
jgi:hypothetical protein